MNFSPRVIPLECQRSPLVGIGSVIEAIGSDEFGARLVGLVRESCGAAFVSAFRICDGRATVVAVAGERQEIADDHARRYVDEMHWRHDPVIAVAGTECQKSSAVLVQVDPVRIEDRILKREFYRPACISDKLAINAMRDNSLFVVSLLRTMESGHFTTEAVDRVAGLADVIVSLLARHATLKTDSAGENLLASVAFIEARLLRAESTATLWRLTPRERQVCARILYGMTATGIALDLGINEYSVDTYRKRAYHRLGIASRHELLRRYLLAQCPPADAQSA